MTTYRKSKLVFVGCLVILALLLTSGAKVARADSCTIANIGDGTTVDLNYNNVGQPGMVITLCEFANSTNTWFQVSGVIGAPGNFGGLVSIMEFGWTPGNYTSAGDPTDPDGQTNEGNVMWKIDTGSQVDGFGTFNTVQSGTASPDADIIFKLVNGTVAPADFEVHFKFENGCTGYAANIPRTDGTYGTTSGGCDSTTVPEPASLALLGTGLFFIGGKLRKKLRK